MEYSYKQTKSIKKWTDIFPIFGLQITNFRICRSIFILN